MSLVGWEVLEVGLRQAWPFLTLGSPGDRVERRLFIDAAVFRSELSNGEALVQWLSGKLLRVEQIVVRLRKPRGLRRVETKRCQV